MTISPILAHKHRGRQPLDERFTRIRLERVEHTSSISWRHFFFFQNQSKGSSWILHDWFGHATTYIRKFPKCMAHSFFNDRFLYLIVGMSRPVAATFISRRVRGVISSSHFLAIRGAPLRLPRLLPGSPVGFLVDMVIWKRPHAVDLRGSSSTVFSSKVY